METTPPPCPKSLAEAIEWRTRLADLRIDSSPEFETWLAEDPEHRRAWAEAQALWAKFDDLAAEPDMIAARREALARTAPARDRWSWVFAVAAAAAALVIAVVGYTALRTETPQTYRTGHGAPREIALSDGSQVTLDAESLLKVSFQGDVRDLDLLQGRAQFDVARDPHRPFSVRAGDRTVVATGTSFQVEHEGSLVRVVLIQGRIEVVADPPAGHPALEPVAAHLHPGEELSARQGGAAAVGPVDVQRATSWEYGMLTFDDKPLSEVADEVSRYTSKPVRTGDAGAAALRLSGVFRAGDLNTFVDTVTHYLPVRAEDTASAVVLRSAGPAGGAQTPRP